MKHFNKINFMKRLLQLVISLLFFIPLAWSQPNLVPNPSFENK